MLQTCGNLWIMQVSNTWKSLIGEQHRDFFDCKNNADGRVCDEEPYTSKERRVLIMYQAGRAWGKLYQTKYDKLNPRFWKKIGCLIIKGGSKDYNIKPGELPNYVVPPPTFLEPSKQNAVDCNIPEERHTDTAEEPIQLENYTEAVKN